MHIEVYKKELAWAIHKWLRVFSSIMLIKNHYNAEEQKNIVILSLKQYCMHCYVVLSNVF